ncbi:RICIN domain-containing protein [Labilithrix luteola]|uniref:RICIN domain-containing protein n=1 Tax=Labilithrix luteola TaxID=1391654 RepID=UPI001472FAC7|nr:RICIN domain-containing protein [Labilithrix luteola]
MKVQKLLSQALLLSAVACFAIGCAAESSETGSIAEGKQALSSDHEVGSANADGVVTPNGAQAAMIGAISTTWDTGICLSGADVEGSYVVTAICNGSGAQKWVFQPSTFELSLFGRCLQGASSGGRPQLVTCNGSNAQKWNIVSLQSGPNQYAFMNIGSRFQLAYTTPVGPSQAIYNYPANGNVWYNFTSYMF